MRNVRVALWGFGAMGGGAAKVLLKKRGVEITGVCDLHPDRVGKSIFALLDVDRKGRTDVIVMDDIDAALSYRGADVCIVATDSFTKEVFPKLIRVIEKGVNVICTAEEMSFPAAKEPGLAEKLDCAAKESGVSVLGTGINPGLMMDLLAICLTGCMTDVEKVACRRVNSLSPFGPAVMREQGVGLSEAEFEEGVQDGTLAGHVGFAESVGMIAKALGWKIDRFEQQMSPILTDVDRRSPYGFAKRGGVAGVNMTGQGSRNGETLIDMIHPQQIEPEIGGVHTGDFITLEGKPRVDMAIQPEVDGGVGTIAMCVNMIPQVINARPGLKTMIDLPVPHAVMGDMRDQIEEGILD
jgi:4-hydroxy-tetrahydrodipicolinate reductase